ncbi:MBL fold metallo-hydrolase [Elusimicrobiota bacterium]
MPKKDLIIRQLELGPLSNFVYILGDPDTKEACVIDPAWDTDAIKKTLENEKFKLKFIILSHHHFDHSGGLKDLVDKAENGAYIHEADLGELEDTAGSVKKIPKNGKIKLGGIEIECLHTPGHTQGSVCIIAGNNIFTGDTLFVRACGRVDLPGSDPEKMYMSLKKLMDLDDNLTVWPGHNYGPAKSMSLKIEKEQNPFLRLGASSKEDFLRTMGG